MKVPEALVRESERLIDQVILRQSRLAALFYGRMTWSTIMRQAYAEAQRTNFAKIRLVCELRSLLDDLQFSR